MKRTFTLLCSLLVVTFAMGQRPEGVFAKGSAAPEIDGVVDEVWAEATVYNIDKPFAAEVPSLGDEGETTWQAMWTEDGVYILLKVTDDEWLPAATGQNNWEYDKPEIYFDVNYELVDGIGGGGGKGHYQFAPGFTEGKTDGQAITDNQMVYAFLVEGSNYIAEYFIPYTRLLDSEGNEVDKTNTIGFDVTIIDRDGGDTGRKRAVWANIGGINESYGNMDDCGYVTFGGMGEKVDIESIAISGGQDITTDNGTVQLTAAIQPADYTQAYKWVITEGAGNATISAEGLLTASKTNGTIKVKAVSADQFVNSNEITLNISGQVVTQDEINMLKNGHFLNGIENWGDASGAGAIDAEGFYSVTCTPKAEIWSTMFGQSGLKITDPAANYIVKFKAKASAEMTVPMVMEDRSNQNDKVVTSSSPFRASENWQIPITTEETVYTIDVTFSNLKENSLYELNFQVGKLEGIFSVDDIYMYSAADALLISGTAAKNVANSINKVYPNPVGNGNSLFVELSKANTNVAIYNAVGQKMMEKVSTGNLVKFDVSSLRQGMYFVKLGDGSVQKFIR